MKNQDMQEFLGRIDGRGLLGCWPLVNWGDESNRTVLDVVNGIKGDIKGPAVWQPPDEQENMHRINNMEGIGNNQGKTNAL